MTSNLFSTVDTGVILKLPLQQSLIHSSIVDFYRPWLEAIKEGGNEPEAWLHYADYIRQHFKCNTRAQTIIRLYENALKVNLYFIIY